MALTPMLKQYFDIKEKYKNEILFLGWEIFMKCLGKTL